MSMTYVDNRTPFTTELFSFPDKKGQEIQLLVVAATFEANADSELVPIVPQTPVKVADEYFGDPALSSVRYEADIALEKTFVDVIVNGVAYAPESKLARAVVVELHIGEIHKRLIVHGDRKKRSLFLGTTIRPEPFITMPIVYERAFGGSDIRAKDSRNHKIYSWNPVGVGFRGVQSNDPGIQTHVPNIEYVGSKPKSIKKVPAGFGIIGRSWSPRLKFAGTYDKEWLDTQWPLFPLDFNPLHFQSAPYDQQSQTIKGGEMVHLINLTSEGVWKFRLPKLNFPVRLLFDDRQEELELKLDTVFIEPDKRQVCLSHRVSYLVERNRSPIREIILGHISNGWLRAKLKRKSYWDLRGFGGTLSNKPCYT